MGDGLEAVWVVAAEVEDVFVVGAGVGGGDFGVSNVGFPVEAKGRVDEGGVDAFLIEDLDSGGRVGERRER